MPNAKSKRKTPAKAAAVDNTATAAPSLPFAPRTPARPFADATAVPVMSDQPQATVADVQRDYAAPAQQSPSNVLGDPKQNLQTFTLNDLASFTKEATYSTDASKDVHLFYVGRDDVHDILKYLLSRVTISLYLNMFGFDDSELNNILMQKALNPAVTMLITLDQSQAGGVHEKALIEADQKYNLASYNTHFVVGQSLTHQISHTKGFVADGKVAAEGSVNWSSAGEGTFVVLGQPGGAGYKAQNNTQSVITDRDTIIRFQTELIAEHMIAQSAVKPPGTPVAAPLPNRNVTPATVAISKGAAGASGESGAKQAPGKTNAVKRTAAKKTPATAANKATARSRS